MQLSLIYHSMHCLLLRWFNHPQSFSEVDTHSYFRSLLIFLSLYYFLVLDLEAIIKECQQVVGEINNGPSAWQKRMANLNENWESVREAIFENVVCSFAPPSSPLPCCKCSTNEAVLRCWECGVDRFLCASCDEEVHQCQPFHDREVWSNGYFQYILPTQTVSQDSKLIHVGMSVIFLLSCT